MLKRLAKAICPALPAYRARFERWIEYRREEARAIGANATARLWFACAFEKGRKLACIRPAGYRHPLFFRPGGSDPRVIEQVLVRREYECVAGLPGVEFIVDCGANIGLSTYFLLNRYPAARAVVAEPDPWNMAVCRRNLAAFGDRVTFVQAGVWSASGDLVIERGTYRDGAEWSTQVRLAAPGEVADIPGVTVLDLMKAAGFPRIDVLKVDIEGSEVEVFGPGSERWLPLTRNIAVELHGPECERVVTAALVPYRHELDHCGELTVYREIRVAH